MPFTLSLAFAILLGLTHSAPTPCQTLETILTGWENANKAIKTLSADVTRTTLEKAFQTTDVFEGTVKYMRPNLGSLRLAQKDKPEKHEEYGFTGTHIYMDHLVNKTRLVVEMPASWSGKPRAAAVPTPEKTGSAFWFSGSPDWLVDSGPIPLLFGMKANEARRRYEMTLLKAPNDRWYDYILIKPKRPADRWWFSKARLVLNKKTHLIRQLWFERGNGIEMTWDFTRMRTQIALNRKQFVNPPLKKGWTYIESPDRADP